MNQLNSTIESILFVANKPLSTNQIAKILEKEKAEVETALNEIAELRKESGIVLLNSGDTWELSTNSKNSTQVKNFLNADLRERLTDATVETLAIIAYRQPISKGEIEAIRGVNCQYSIRHLLIRGLIQKVSNPKDSRQVLYETTVEFLQHMGLQSTKDLPEFETLVEKIQLPEAPDITEKPVEETKNTENENIDEQP
jgi:segregation and condensation protein B